VGHAGQSDFHDDDMEKARRGRLREAEVISRDRLKRGNGGGISGLREL
jgi:hypothetical protein